MTDEPRLFGQMTHAYDRGWTGTGQADSAGCLSEMTWENHNPNGQQPSVSFTEPPRLFDQRPLYTVGIGSSSPIKKLLRHGLHNMVNNGQQECRDNKPLQIKSTKEPTNYYVGIFREVEQT